MVGSDAGSYVISLAGGLSSLRCARFSSFILRFSMRFISFWRFWNVVVIASPHSRVRRGPWSLAVQPIHGKGKLPAWLARLPRRLTVILVRHAVASAALAASPAASSARSAKIPWTAWRAAFALRPRFIHLQIASANFFSIEGGHGCGCFRVIGHLDKSETARAPGFPVHCHVHARDLAERCKQLAQFGFRSLEA